MIRSGELYAPEPEKLSDDGILARMRTLYRKARFDELKRRWDMLAAHPGTPQFGRFRKSLLKRMWNAGECMKTLKQHFIMSYNSRREHAGTMWEGRYHVRAHKPLVLHASLSLAAGEGRLHRAG